MGKWLDALKNLQANTFGGFGCVAIEPLTQISDEEIKSLALQRLTEAAEGLPVTKDELADFFVDDLKSFGLGEVSQPSITRVVRWYVFRHKETRNIEMQGTPKGMVRCSDCQQNRCQWKQVTRYGNVVTHSSPAYRWCNNYTAKILKIENYRKP